MDVDVGMLQKRLIDTIDIFTVLENNHDTLVSSTVIQGEYERAMPQFVQMTLGELQARLDFEFSINVTMILEHTYVQRLLSGKTDPCIPVLAALMASSAIPVVFPIVQLELNDVLVQCADGDILSTTVSDTYDESVVHIGGRYFWDTISSIDTGLPILDTGLQYLSRLIRTSQSSVKGRRLTHSAPVGLHREEYDYERCALELADNFETIDQS